MKKKYIAAILYFVFLTNNVFPQNILEKRNDTLSTPNLSLNKQIKKDAGINYIKLSGITAFTIGAVLVLHNIQKNAWWSGERSAFHIRNDWKYALWMDKIGHFMEGSLIAKTMKGAFIWSGMKERDAMWLGALFSIGYMTDIEIEDGFASEWGYSPGDELSNLAGDVFSIAQDLWSPLQTVKIKWSYVPTGDPKHKGDFPDDYGGQVFWLSFDINKYFEKKVEPRAFVIPDYLNLALGYGVLNYTNYGPGGRIQNLYLGLDFNLRNLIPGTSSFMKFLKEFLDTFKIIPTPALKYNITDHKFGFVIR